MCKKYLCVLLFRGCVVCCPLGLTTVTLFERLARRLPPLIPPGGAALGEVCRLASEATIPPVVIEAVARAGAPTLGLGLYGGISAKGLFIGLLLIGGLELMELAVAADGLDPPPLPPRKGGITDNGFAFILDVFALALGLLTLALILLTLALIPMLLERNLGESFFVMSGLSLSSPIFL